jgi:malonyl CoA-acyl carrier protein transacylase/phosphopantetheinyl transferase
VAQTGQGPAGTRLVLFEAESRPALEAELLHAVSRATRASRHTRSEASTYASAAPRWRAALVYTSEQNLVEQLGRAVQQCRALDSMKAGRSPHGAYLGQTQPGKGAVFLFPGFGSEYPGLCQGLAEHFPSVQATLHEFTPLLPEGSRERYFGAARGSSDTGREQRHGFQGGGQVGFVASLMSYRLLRSLGLHPRVLLGHSHGENVALVAAHALRLGSASTIAEVLHRMPVELVSKTSGRNVAVTLLDPTALDAWLLAHPQLVACAMFNCPKQRVLFAREAGFAPLRDAVRERGGLCLELPPAPPFHTPFLEGSIAAELGQIYQQLRFDAPELPVYSSSALRYFSGASEDLRALALYQWTHPVRFDHSVRALFGDGYDVFVEVAPNAVLTGFVADTLHGKPHLAICSDTPRRGGLEQLHHLFGSLYVRGVLDPASVGSSDSTGVRFSHAELSLPLSELWHSRAPDESAAPDLRPAPPLAAIHTGAVLAHFELMNDFLRVQDASWQDWVATWRRQRQGPAALRPAAEAASPRAPFRLEFELHPGRQRFLLDHAIGGKKSTRDGACNPLPILAFTHSLELLWQAARAAQPLDSTARANGAAPFPIVLESVRALRWLTVDTAPDYVVGDVRAAENSAADSSEFEVQLAKPGQLELGKPAVTARVHFDGSRAPAPLPERSGRAARLELSEFHAYVFHGERFRCLEMVEAVGPRSIRARVRMKALPSVLEGSPTRVPSALLDATGQLVAFWLMEHGWQDFGVFPYTLAQYIQWERAPEEGDELVVSAHIEHSELDSSRVEADFDFSLCGRRLCSFRGLHLRPVRSTWFRPLFEGLDQLQLSRRIGGLGEPICRGLLLQETLIEKDTQGVWLDSIARLCLGATERSFWQGLGPTSSRGREWLLGRVVAKEAIREAAQTQLGIALTHHDLVLLPGAHGQPTIGCRQRDVVERLSVSISHSKTEVVAAVACFPLGVDIEPSARDERKFGWMESTLSPGERDLLDEQKGNYTMLWTAREAAAKVSGEGLLATPSSWQLSSYDGSAGRGRIQHGDRGFDFLTTEHANHVLTLAWQTTEAGG